MAIVLEGDGTISGVTTFTTPLDDISFDSINVTGIVTASTFQVGTGVSISSPRSQTLALFTNNTETFHITNWFLMILNSSFEACSQDRIKSGRLICLSLSIQFITFFAKAFKSKQSTLTRLLPNSV